MATPLIVLYLLALFTPGAAMFWWLMTALDPRLAVGLPAPRRADLLLDSPVEIHPLHNDWRGFA